MSRENARQARGSWIASIALWWQISERIAVWQRHIFKKSISCKEVGFRWGGRCRKVTDTDISNHTLRLISLYLFFDRTAALRTHNALARFELNLAPVPAYVVCRYVYCLPACQSACLFLPSSSAFHSPDSALTTQFVRAADEAPVPPTGEC